MLKRLVKDMLIYLPAQFLPALTAFITTPILTRLFTPAEYGYWAMASSISAFLVALAVSGFGSAVIRFYPAYKARSALNVFFATLSISIGSIIIGVAALSFLVLYLTKGILPPSITQLLPLAILIFVGDSLLTVFLSAIRAQGRSGLYTTFQLLTKYGGLGIGLLLVVYWGFRVDGLLWGALLTSMLILPLLIFLVTRGVGVHPQRFLLSDALQISQYAWPLILSNVAMWGLRVSDLFIIRLFRPEGDVGLYSVSYTISAKSIELLVALFLLNLGPLVMNTWESDGRVPTERALSMVTRVYLILCLPAAIGLCVLASPILGFLAAEEYHEGFRIVGFVVFSSFTWGLAQICMMGAQIQKKTRQLAVNTVIAVTIHLGLQFLLVPRFGYIASAVSTLIGYIVLLVLHLRISQPHLTWHFPFSTLRNTGIASAAMGLAAWWVYGMSSDPDGSSLTYLFLSVFAGVLVYVVCLWFTGEVRSEEKYTLQHLWYRIIKKDVQADSKA